MRKKSETEQKEGTANRHGPTKQEAVKLNTLTYTAVTMNMKKRTVERK